MRLPSLLLFCLFSIASAGRAVDDGAHRLVWLDTVANSQPVPCGDGYAWLPENSVPLGSPDQGAMPFRKLTIALPSKELPDFRVENVATQAWNGKLCSNRQLFPQMDSESVAVSWNVRASEPYLRDGLWRTDLLIPLLSGNDGSWIQKQVFRVVVDYRGSASGRSPGARALSSVHNPGAAKRFGTATSSLRKTVSTAYAAQDVDWLAVLSIGDRDLATFNEDGWYGVSFAQLRNVLRSSGRDGEIDGIPLSSLRLFGASPDTLAEAVGGESTIKPRLAEIPITVRDVKNNGIFDDGDSVYFLGWGTSTWRSIPSTAGLDYGFSASPYSYTQQFYLGVGGKGSRLADLPVVDGASAAPAWKRYLRMEKDQYLRDIYFGDNYAEETTGKEWFWTWGQRNTSVSIGSSEFSRLYNLPGIVGDSLWLGISFYPHRSTSTNAMLSSRSYESRMSNVAYSASFAGNALGQGVLAPGGAFVHAVSGAAASGNSLSLRLEANAIQNDRFDGVTAAYRFDPVSGTGNGEWLLPGAITGKLRFAVPAQVKVVKVRNDIPVGWLTVVSGYATDSIGASEDVRYFLVPAGSVLQPVVAAAEPPASGIADLLQLSASTQYVIIVPARLQSQALALAAFRNGGEAVKRIPTEVVLYEDIVRDFGGGQSSPVAVRDYLRYARSIDPSLQYVLLASDGHYDYRLIRSTSPVQGIPPYENEDLSTDDFFAVLDSGEQIRFGKYDLDLAIGRLPVSDEAAFAAYNAKVRQYEQTSLMDNDSWRNTVLLLADDAMQRDFIDGINHTAQQERIGAMVDSNALARNFAIDLRKLYLLQYERDASYQKPEAAKDLLARFNQGALFSFYSGHGSSTAWADEGLLKVSSIYEVDNAPRYTILGSFACTVGRFDEAQVTSLSEVFMATPGRGAIASIGAMRESYANPNEALSRDILYHSLFTPGITIGAAIKRAKGEVSADYTARRYNNEKYVLLGEPVLSMPSATLNMTITNPPDTLQALQKVELAGTVSTTTGKIRLQVMEGARLKTLTQDLSDGSVYSIQAKVPGNPIHSETMGFANGLFQTTFVTPRKIAFGDTAAQIRLWGWTPGSSEVGRALVKGLPISGTSTYADSLDDQLAPDIQIYPCTKTGSPSPFAEGQRVSLEIPACLEVHISDSTGLDYREEADEGITFEVIGTTSPWHPWPFIEQSGRNAVARVQFGTRYQAGDYVLRVMAQDILGNVSYRSLAVQLAAQSRQGLANVYNVPNPVGKKGTVFYFKDLSGDRVNRVTIQIFDQNGRLVKVLRDVRSGETRWDGRDQHGRLLANGLYHYVVQNAVYPGENGGDKQLFTRKQKLVISR